MQFSAGAKSPNFDHRFAPAGDFSDLGDGALFEVEQLHDQPILRIERGELRGISIMTVDTVTQALGARLDLRVLWRAEGLERLLDRRHAALVDLVVRRLRRYGWQVVVEASFSNLWRARLNRHRTKPRAICRSN